MPKSKGTVTLQDKEEAIWVLMHSRKVQSRAKGLAAFFGIGKDDDRYIMFIRTETEKYARELVE